MSRPTIIALSGWKRSGKDTVAEYLIKNYGAERIAFADPLKDSVAQQFGLTRAFIDDPATKESPILTMPVDPRDAFSKTVTNFMSGEFRDQNGKRYGEGTPDSVMYWTPRALCILEGSTKRSADPDFWVKQAVAKTSPGGLYVISDARYKNEMESLKKTGANIVTVRIERFDSSPSNDPSERDLDDYKFDHVLNNRFGIDQLFDVVDRTLFPASQIRTHKV